MNKKKHTIKDIETSCYKNQKIFMNQVKNKEKSLEEINTTI